MLPKSGTTPTALLNELRAFMAQRRRAPLPAFLPTDTPLILRGRKHLLSKLQSSLNFSCTGCGSCCRSYSSTVLIDPRDVFAMRLPPNSGPHSSVSQQHPDHFVHRVGLFTLEALPPNSNPPIKVGSILHGLPITRPRGTAPIVFLRAHTDESGGEKCSFALEERRGGGLTCSLGPDRMPLSCALYPLGYFMPTDGQDSFFSVDTRGCEGLGGGEKQQGGTVESYLDARGLGPRVANASWYQSLATAWACSGMEHMAEGVKEPIETLRQRLVTKGISPPSWLQQEASVGMASSNLPSPLLIALRQAIRNIWYENGGVLWSREVEEGMERRTKEVFDEATAVIKNANL